MAAVDAPIMMVEENTQSREGRECQCKGVRACALCEHKRTAGHRLNLARIRRAFVFCPKCQMCFLVDPQGASEPSQIHGVNLPGISVVEEAVTEPQETFLQEAIERTKWVESQSGRLKQDFGPKVNFKKQKVKSDAFLGFPSYMTIVMEAFFRLGQNMMAFEPVELCNLKYSPQRGSCIDPHFDDWWLWGERLATLNLCGDTVLTFSRAEDFNDLTSYESSKGTSDEDNRTGVAIRNNRYEKETTGSSPPEYSLSTEDIVAASRTHQCSLSTVKDGCSLLEEQQEFSVGDVVHVALPRRSVVLVEKDARFKWHHSVLREHITETRLAMTIRELSDNFRDPSKSKEFEVGKELLAKAQINLDL